MSQALYNAKTLRKEKELICSKDDFNDFIDKMKRDGTCRTCKFYKLVNRSIEGIGYCCVNHCHYSYFSYCFKYKEKITIIGHKISKKDLK